MSTKSITVWITHAENWLVHGVAIRAFWRGLRADGIPVLFIICCLVACAYCLLNDRKRWRLSKRRENQL